jgi:hypothetical protein
MSAQGLPLGGIYTDAYFSRFHPELFLDQWDDLLRLAGSFCATFAIRNSDGKSTGSSTKVRLCMHYVVI